MTSSKSLVPMRPSDYQGTTIFVGNDQVSIQGELRENMTLEEARAYLNSHPDGFLHHDIFETESFVTKAYAGHYVFYDCHKDQPESWSWDKDIEDLREYAADSFNIDTGWWYEPGEYAYELIGGMAWFDAMRNSGPF